MTASLLCALLLLLVPASDPPQNVAFQEKLLGVAPDGVTPSSVAFSPDGRLVAYVGMSGGKPFVAVGDDRGPTYDAIVQGPYISADGRQVGFLARRGTSAYCVVNRRESRAHEQVGGFTFSPDGRQYAYLVMGSNYKAFVYVGENPGPEFQRVGNPYFAPKGGTVAYSTTVPLAAQGGVSRRTYEHMCIAGKLGQPYDSVNRPYFSPDGRLVAYVAKAAETTFVVLGTQRGEAGTAIRDLVFSPDSRSLAYAVQKAQKWSVVLDGRRGEEFDDVFGNPVFSADGKHLAYAAAKGKVGFIVLDGAKVREWDGVEHPRFSPDGKTVAYAARKGSLWQMIVGEKEGLAFSTLSAPIWSPDGTRVCYTGMQRASFHAVAGDSLGPNFEQVGQPVWSPDGKTFACAVLRRGKWMMMVNHAWKEEFDELYGAPVFSADSSKVGFGARRKGELWWKVVELK